ncbi:MAG: CARDB domain-containing protein [Solirubrobacteraceae bacterium]
MQTRRGVLAVVVVIFVILIAVGVHSCQVSSDQSALKDYANSVSSLISRSDATGTSLFKTLSSGGGSSNGLNLTHQIDETRQAAANVLSSAQQTSAPDSVKTANANLQLALRMRVDGITNIAGRIQSALGGATSGQAITQIASEMARFYASDVLYKDYTATALASALHANGIGVGGTINAGQFVPDVQWLLPSHIAAELKVSLPTASGGATSAQGCNPCGHTLNSVSVNGTTLQTGSPNTIPAKPAPTFRLNITNGGNKNESNVVCKVSVNGTSSSGQTTIPQTQSGQTTSCDVPLKSPPAAGTYTVQATVEKVPGEKNTSNNSQGYTVTFG